MKRIVTFLAAAGLLALVLPGSAPAAGKPVAFAVVAGL